MAARGMAEENTGCSGEFASFRLPFRIHGLTIDGAGMYNLAYIIDFPPRRIESSESGDSQKRREGGVSGKARSQRAGSVRAGTSGPAEMAFELRS
jgi:hypothetical protein